MAAAHYNQNHIVGLVVVVRIECSPKYSLWGPDRIAVALCDQVVDGHTHLIGIADRVGRIGAHYELVEDGRTHVVGVAAGLADWVAGAHSAPVAACHIAPDLGIGTGGFHAGLVGRVAGVHSAPVVGCHIIADLAVGTGDFHEPVADYHNHQIGIADLAVCCEDQVPHDMAPTRSAAPTVLSDRCDEAAGVDHRLAARSARETDHLYLAMMLGG